MICYNHPYHMNVTLTQTDRKDIVEALRSGKATVDELSSKYGIARSHVYVIYRKETGAVSKPVKRLSKSEKEAIITQLQTNKVTMTELAQSKPRQVVV